jgi:imidazolonepropionase-like amidohydrolase
MRLLLRGQQLIDGTGATPLPSPLLLIDDDQIVAVQSGHNIPPAWGNVDRVLDYSHCTLLPGLIDAHVHLIWGGTTDPVVDLRQESNEHLLLRAADNARLSLFAGVTTVRDCGGRDGTTFVIREAIERGLIPGPRVRACGRPVTQSGGHCHFFHGEADGLAGVRDTIARLVDEGADFIKIMATGGGMTSTTNPGEASYSTAEMRLAVEAAAAHGLTVGAHCHGLAGMRNAVEAGCRTIEHASFMTPERAVLYDPHLGERLVERGTYIVPTLTAGYHPAARLRLQATRTPEEEQGLRQRERREAIIATLYRMGARIVYGTDNGVNLTPFGEPVLGLQLMQQVGMTPLQAIHSATGLAAEALDMADTIGTLQAGKKADILAVTGDPTQDLSVLTHLDMVMLGGKPLSPLAPIHWQEAAWHR